MLEWSATNKYNSFNSWKGLAYVDHLRKTVAWLDGNGTLPPPIEVNLDPFAECNLSCYFCIVQRYLKHNRAEVGDMRKLPAEYMHDLVDFIADWGVKGLCVSGGGDPSLHEETPKIIKHADARGLKASMFTNAVSLSDKFIYEAMKCQWITLSVDASNACEYSQIKGRNRFASVIQNIKEMVTARQQLKKDVMLTWCSLVLPENQHTLHEQCKLAKELGVQVFRVRPVDFERADIEGHRRLPIDVPAVMEQFDKCHEEETETFKVITTTHKFSPTFHVEHHFNRCYPTLILPLLTDGHGYLCVDHKMEAVYRLGSGFPDPKEILRWWGSEAHRQLIQSVDITKCSRCTGSIYNEIVENAILKDGMCLSFP